MELGDAAAFKAEVARVEANAGAKLPVARTGDQEYWQPGNDTLSAAIAVQGNHLVVTLFPPKASDALKQTLLGVTRPAQNIADAGTLQTLAKQYTYSTYGEGFVDFVRIVEILSKPLAGSDAEFAQALGLPAIASDAACRTEYLEIAHKFPRVVFGAEEMSAQRMRIATQLEIDTRIAQQFASAIGAAPGTGAASEGAIDFSIALPVLRLKDFWIAQADAVAAKPYACEKLHSLNEGFAASKAKVDVTVPPPLSDLTGLRASMHLLVIERRDIDATDVTVHSDHRRQAGRQMQVGSLVLDRKCEKFSDIHARPPFRLKPCCASGSCPMQYSSINSSRRNPLP